MFKRSALSRVVGCLWAVGLFVSSLGTVAGAQCRGDCNADSAVTIDEVISLVNIALGLSPITQCSSGDANGDAEITVDEIIAAVGFALNGCPTGSITVRFDFRDGEAGWVADFADYSPGQLESLQLEAGPRAPAEIEVRATAFMLRGNNVSDDLFMFLKRRLATADGVLPNTDYRLDYTIQFASNAPTGCTGIGGAPGESVFLKAGGATLEPQVALDPQAGLFRISVDKGNQSQGGAAASVVGNIANGWPCDGGPAPYVSLTRCHVHDASVRSAADGSLWLLIGTDSGFEGPTEIYYQSVEVTLRQQQER